MRITIVTGFFLPVPPLRGGSTEKIWYRLAQEFSRAGHQVTMVSRQWAGLPDNETNDGIRHLRIPGTDHKRSLAINLLLDARWGIRVAKVLPPADVVICNTVTLPIWLKRVKSTAGRVCVVLNRMPKGQCRWYGNVDLVLATSSSVAEQVRRENQGLASRTRILPNPVDWQQHARAGALRAPSPELVTIGFVGRIHPEKGLRLLCAAAARLLDGPLLNWRLLIVGPWKIPDGGGGDEFVAGMRRDFGPALGDRVLLTGPQFDAEKLAAHYGAMDIFCYPSLAEKGETFGISIAEAMAAGCAPVVSNLACFRDLITPDLTGLVFEHSTPHADERLASTLLRLLRDPELRRRISRQAQEHVRRFDFAESAAAILKDLQGDTTSRPH